jgi:hypothetical protein
MLLAILAVSALLLSACGGPSSAGTNSSSAPPAPSSGYPPVDPRTPNSHYQEVVDIALGKQGQHAGLDDFWRAQFRTMWPNLTYSSPASFHPYTPGRVPEVDPECLPDDPAKLTDNAFYCSKDRTVSWDEAFLKRQYSTIGDMAPAVILAHEWGHHIQWLSGFNGFTLQKELQADCYAGMYVRFLSTRGMLENGDLEETSRTLFSVGNKDFTDSNWFLPGVHGKPISRLLAVNLGELSVDGNICVSYASYHADDILRLGSYSLAISPEMTRQTLSDGTTRLSDSQGMADVRGMPDLPAQPAATQFSAVSAKWFGTSQVKVLGEMMVNTNTHPAGTAAFQRYEQTYKDAAGRPVTVHGILYLHVGPSGGGVILDVDAPGPASTAAGDWKTLETRLTKLRLGLVRTD